MKLSPQKSNVCLCFFFYILNLKKRHREKEKNMSSKTGDKRGPRPPLDDDDRGEGKMVDTPKKSKKKRGPRTPAPPRPPSDDEEVETFNQDDQEGSKTSGGGNSKEADSSDPIHTSVFRSAESDEEEDSDNAAAIMPAGEIDMAELMMNIRSAPGAIDNQGTPDVSLAARPRRGVSASKLDDSDDDFHIPTLGGSPSDSEREKTASTRQRDRRD